MQSLILQPHQADPFTLLKASGELDLHNQDQFEQMVADSLRSGPVIVDLSGLEFFAICALRSLVVCHRLATSTGHELCFAQPSSQLLRLLRISGLLEVLPVRPTLDRAVTAG